MTEVTPTASAAVTEIPGDLLPDVNDAAELTDSEKLDQVFRFCAQFGQIMEGIMPMVQKLAEHPMLASFLS